MLDFDPPGKDFEKKNGGHIGEDEFVLEKIVCEQILTKNCSSLENTRFKLKIGI